MVLYVDTSAISAHVTRLERISRSALPVAIRQTLTAAAYRTKTRTMPEEAERFVHRKPTFFKANSKVVAATGFDINSMAATVGFVPKPGDKSHSVEDLEQQEHGGDIANRAFIALPSARMGNSMDRMVKAPMRLENIRTKILNPMASPGKNMREKFIRTAIHAGRGGFVLGTDKAKGMLMRINSVKRVGRNTEVNSTAIYSVKAHRKVTPGGRYHDFMSTASVRSAHSMESDFVTIANKRIARA